MEKIPTKREGHANIYGIMYGLSTQINDSTHAVRTAIENGRWHEVLIGLRAVHQHIRKAGDLLRQIEPIGYIDLMAEIAKLDPPAGIETTEPVAPAGGEKTGIVDVR